MKASRAAAVSFFLALGAANAQVYTTAVSTDAGANWTARGLASEILTIAVDPVNPSIVYASDLNGIHKSTNGGADWTALPGSPGKVNSLAINPANPNIIHAGIDGHVTRTPAYYSVSGLSSSVSVDQGVTWTSTSASSYQFALQSMMYLAGSPATRYWIHEQIDSCYWNLLGGRCTYSHLICRDRGGTDCVATPNVSQIAPAPLDPCTVYAGTWSGEVLRSTDCGSLAFTDLSANLPNGVNALAASPVDTGTLVAGLTNGQIYRKSGPGPWTLSATLASQITAVVFQPGSGQVIYAGTEGGIHKSTNGGLSFSPTSFANGKLRALAIGTGAPTTIHAGSACSYTYTPQSANLANAAGAASVSVAAPAQCEWFANSYEDWITITSGPSGSGTGTVTYTFTTNPNPTPRYGRIYLGGGTFEIVQAGQPCPVTLTPSGSNTAAGGTLAVSASLGCAWTASSDAPWILVTAGASGTGSGSVTFKLLPNASPSGRSGAITVAGQAFTITQGPVCPNTATPSAVNVGSNGGPGSVHITAGCAWYAVSNVAWITTAASGNGNGDLAYTVQPNTSTSPRTGTLTTGGATITVNQAESTGIPTVGVPNPSAGSGMARTFAFPFSDENGAFDLAVLNVLINSAIDGRNACYLAYVPSGGGGTVFLVNNAGDAGGPFAGSLTIPGGGSIANGQCTIHGTGSSATMSGNTLTLVLSISFSNTFWGNRILYTAARDTAGHNSGWVAKGVWTVPGVLTPSTAVTSLSPTRATTSTAALTLQFFDDTGFADLSVLNVLINNAIDGRNACYLAFVRSGGTLYLVNDAGEAGGPFAGSIPIPGSGIAANSQCSINASGSWVSGAGNVLTLSLNVTFKAVFAGDRIVYAAARDNAGNNSGWQAMGTITAP
ncbi:MAG: BACON domain-containing carbohydrate-binding protein [Bryobacteraceae bacterium]